MPATITRKCQEAFEFVQKRADSWHYRERTFANNTQVEVSSNGDWKIWLFNTPIISFCKDRNEYEVKNGGWRTRTTSHDIRAYLRLFLDYDFRDWEIYHKPTETIHCEDYEINRGRWITHGRKWVFNPTALIFRRND